MKAPHLLRFAKVQTELTIKNRKASKITREDILKGSIAWGLALSFLYAMLAYMADNMDFDLFR